MLNKCAWLINNEITASLTQSTTSRIIENRYIFLSSNTHISFIIDKNIKKLESNIYRYSAFVIDSCNRIGRKCREGECRKKSTSKTLNYLARGFGVWWRIGFTLQPFSSHTWIEINATTVGDNRATHEYLILYSVAPALCDERTNQEEGMKP